ncbi:hypothetical protein [Haloactinopolyspora sp.]|uniref:hypothetical protein n=1 Tax=Haloactinopolyspora sp. TaxID=1966353 RepID=UPI002626CE13|nr:hypothetical protein [Haloactinopolyspora sp.]
MNRPHPLTALNEWEWTRSWEEQQEIIDRLNSAGGTWLPNIVEPRRWGAMRWTSGRPSHAADSGQAVPETFVVLRPGLDDPELRDRLPEVLREPPPMFNVAGIGARRHHVMGLAPGALLGAVVLAVLAGVIGLGGVGVVVGLLLGLGLGATAGAMVAQYVFERDRSAVLKDSERVRVVTGRYAPTSWSRLVEATTGMERASAGDSEPDDQAAEAVQTALWEAAGLLLSSSDHTGVEVLADGMERLAQAHRG